MVPLASEIVEHATGYPGAVGPRAERQRSGLVVTLAELLFVRSVAGAEVAARRIVVSRSTSARLRCPQKPTAQPPSELVTGVALALRT
jgi:hypothetical protein